MYLLILDHSTDAERKRIDYAIERWQSKLSIRKPKGTIIVVDGNQKRINEFIEDLCARLENSEQKVEVYKIEGYKPEIEKNIQKLSYESEESPEFVEKFVDYLMAKLNASYEYSTEVGKVYRVYTKKGQANLEITIRSTNNETKLNIAIEGYGDVVNFLSEKIDNEMKTFLEGG